MKAVVPFRPDLIDMLLLLTKGMKPEVLRLVQHSTHGTCKLLTDELFSLPIPIPPMAEQRRIVSKSSELITACDQLESSLSMAEGNRCRFLEAVLHEALFTTAYPPDVEGVRRHDGAVPSEERAGAA